MSATSSDRKPAPPTGTRLDAQARIVFDTNAPIDTPAIFNTIDADAPSSAVNTLPDVTSTPSFLVSWAGQDAGGSGIAAFDIYVATDGGDYLRWIDDTIATQATFAGEFGHTYAFYSVATDMVGHLELSPAIADTTTTVDDSVPVAVSDNYLATENEPLVIPASEGVLKNDEGGVIHAVLVNTPAHGTLVLREDGSFDYTPDENFNREDSFQYRASDGLNESAAATVTITVQTRRAWFNGTEPLDVNDDTSISAIDALQVINELTRNGDHQLPVDRARPLSKPFLDVNRDGWVSASDALRVINYLNRGEGEMTASSAVSQPILATPEMIGSARSTGFHTTAPRCGSFGDC